MDVSNRIFWKSLNVGDIVKVTNAKASASALFSVCIVHPFGLSFLKMRVLREHSIMAALADDWYPLSYLKRKEIEWGLVIKEQE